MFKGICALLFDAFNGCFKWKRVAKHLLLRKTDLLKTSILSERKFEGMY